LCFILFFLAYREEGIYRLSGSSATIQSLKERFNAEGDVDLHGSGEIFDVHAIAGLLKLYLRELPSPVLTRNYQRDFLALTDIQDREERIVELSRLVSLLPLPNYTLLRVLIAHLITVVQNSDENKMSIRNIGIVFSPTLQISAGVFTLMMAEYDDVFCWDDPVRARIAKEKEQKVMERREREKAQAAAGGGEQRKQQQHQHQHQHQQNSYHDEGPSNSSATHGGWDTKDDDNNNNVAKDPKKARRERAGISIMPSGPNGHGGINASHVLQGASGSNLMALGGNVGVNSNGRNVNHGNPPDSTSKAARRGSFVYLDSKDTVMMDSQMAEAIGNANMAGMGGEGGGGLSRHSSREVMKSPPRSPRLPNMNRNGGEQQHQQQQLSSQASSQLMQQMQRESLQQMYADDGDDVEEVVVEDYDDDGYDNDGSGSRSGYRISEYLGAYGGTENANVVKGPGQYGADEDLFG
jgi:hypothetical protein